MFSFVYLGKCSILTCACRLIQDEAPKAIKQHEMKARLLLERFRTRFPVPQWLLTFIRAFLQAMFGRKIAIDACTRASLWTCPSRRLARLTDLVRFSYEHLVSPRAPLPCLGRNISSPVLNYSQFLIAVRQQ